MTASGSAMKAADEPGDRTLELSYFLVAFIDLLGQRDHLRRLTGLPNSADRDDPIVTAFRQSWGAVDGLRGCFVDYFAAAGEEGNFSKTLEPAQRDRLRQLLRTEIIHYAFSDSIIIAVPLKAPADDPTPLNSVQVTLQAAACSAIASLAAEHAIRGGIDVGVCARVSDHEVYGSALERAHELESQKAGHARILLGEELVTYLSENRNAPRDTPLSQLKASTAESALRRIVKDADGQLALDYLGQEVRAACTTVHPSRLQLMVDSAYAFVVAEEARWKAAGDTKLAERYAKVHAYFDSRVHLWGVSRR